MYANTLFSSSIIQRSRNREASRHVSSTTDQKSNKPCSGAWKVANQICAKRLIPFLSTLVEALERHGHLHLTEACRNQLLSMSATTADRLLRSQRKHGPCGISTTRAGTLLKHQIPIRTLQNWNETQPGLTSGGSRRPLWHTSGGKLSVYVNPHRHCDGMDRMHSAPLPQSGDGAGAHSTRTNALSFPIVGINTENGGEFIAESQFPTVEKHTHRSVPEAMTREEVPLFDGHRKFSPMSTQ